MATTLPNKDWHARPTLWTPKDNNLVGANFHPRHVVTSAAALVGYHHMSKIKIPANEIVSNILFYVGAAGVTVANFYGAVYDDAGNRIGITAAKSTELQVAGPKAFALTTPIPAVNYDRVVHGCFTLGSAGTAPTLGISSSVPIGNTGVALAKDLNSGVIAVAGPPAATANYALLLDFYDYWMGLS